MDGYHTIRILPETLITLTRAQTLDFLRNFQSQDNIQVTSLVLLPSISMGVWNPKVNEAVTNIFGDQHCFLAARLGTIERSCYYWLQKLLWQTMPENREASPDGQAFSTFAVIAYAGNALNLVRKLPRKACHCALPYQVRGHLKHRAHFTSFPAYRRF